MLPSTAPKNAGSGCVSSVTRATTPNVPPPPPRNAQNRSWFWHAFATTTCPSAVTTSASSMLAAAMPYAFDQLPNPPPCMNPPAAPTEVHPPPWTYRPCFTGRVGAAGLERRSRLLELPLQARAERAPRRLCRPAGLVGCAAAHCGLSLGRRRPGSGARRERREDQERSGVLRRHSTGWHISLLESYCATQLRPFISAGGSVMRRFSS